MARGAYLSSGHRSAGEPPGGRAGKGASQATPFPDTLATSARLPRAKAGGGHEGVPSSGAGEPSGPGGAQGWRVGMKKGKALLLIAMLFLGNSWAWLPATARFTDSAQNPGNTFQAWTPIQWVQTTQIDFDAGVPNQVDASSSPGDVRLATTTTTLGNSANNAGAATVASAVHTQVDSFATVPYNGEIISWTYYNAGVTSTGARLEFLSGSGTTWTMRAKSDPVTITGTNTFIVSIPVQAGWQLGMYSGSAKVKYDSASGTLSGRTEDSGDFDVGVTKSDFSQSTGHLALTAVLRYYYSSGTIASQVLDTGVAGARWDALFWDETLQGNTDITFEVRASNSSFVPNTPSGTLPWISTVGNSPITSGLPSGQYMQWRATLTTSDTSETPTLHEVRIYCY